MKFTVGVVYSRVSQFLAQEFSLLLGILCLTCILPRFTITVLNQFIINPYLANFYKSVISLISSLICLCLIVLLVEARRTGKPFALHSSLPSAFRNLLPLCGVTFMAFLTIGIATLMFIIPGIIAAVILCVAAPAYIYEKGIDISGSLSRSWDLTLDHRWAIVGIYAPLFVGIGLIFSILFPLTVIISNTLLGSAILLIASSLETLVLNLFSIMIYVTLREVKEGHAPDVTAAVFD